MDLITHNKTKALLLSDYYLSNKDLGSFALEWLDSYDDYIYELNLTNATSDNKPVKGTAFLDSCEAVEAFIERFKISGEYTLTVIDTQKEFFKLLQEIKEELEHDPISCFNNAFTVDIFSSIESKR